MTASPKKIRIFLSKHELNMNFYVFCAKKFILNSCFVKKFKKKLGEIVIIFYPFLKFFIKKMKVRHELTKKQGLTSLMENFRGTRSIMNILGGLKSNIDIFKWIIYLFNSFIYFC